MTAGSPSTMNSHCHPARPVTPFIVTSTALDTGAPTRLAAGMPTMNRLIIRARCARGNHCTRK